MLACWVCLVAGCSPIVSGSADYTRAASRAVGDAASEVATASMVAELAMQDRVTSAYSTVVVSDAEQSIAGIDSTFSQLQPPSETDIQTRSDVLDMLSGAEDAVASVRIAITAGQRPPTGSVERLNRIQQKLDDEAGRLSELAP